MHFLSFGMEAITFAVGEEGNLPLPLVVSELLIIPTAMDLIGCSVRPNPKSSTNLNLAWQLTI